MNMIYGLVFEGFFFPDTNFGGFYLSLKENQTDQTVSL